MSIHDLEGTFEVWLNDVKDLFPELRKVGKKHQAKSFKIGQLRSLDLSIKNNQLLAQHGVLHHQISTAASDI
jgi:uncharacterized lipoprotein YajG